MGTSFIRAFLGSLVVLTPGIYLAPDLNSAYLMAVSALYAAATAGYRAVQHFFPQLSFARWFDQPWAAYADSFTRAFAGTLTISVPAIWYAPDFVTAKALAVAALVGAATAGWRAVQGAVSKGERPFVEKGA